MNLEPDELRALRGGKLTIHALHMELKRAGTGIVTYSGPGQISQTAEGEIEYVIYDSESKPRGDFTRSYVPGSFVDPETLLDLSVRDVRGRRWSAGQTDPSTLRGDGGVICRGTVDEITMSSKSYRPTGESISLFIPEYVEIPSNVFTRISRSAGDRASEELHRNVWEIAGGSYSVRVTQTEEGLDIEATRSEGGFPEQFESRLLEGLWLVLARPLEWQVRMWTRPDTDQLTITRRSAPLEHPRLLPPLMFRRRPQAAEANAVMLLTYLEYLSSYREPRFHPTSVNVRQALLASATNIETEALALGVAVESFIDREYKELCQAEGIDISELNSAVQHWEQWNGSESMKKRVLGAIQRLSGSHPRTAMNKLVASGILTPEQLSAWNKLRHTTAHGKAFDKDPRTVVRWCDMTYAALLRLIFSVIGYQGPYTDYATEGFPEIEFRGPD